MFDDFFFFDFLASAGEFFVFVFNGRYGLGGGVFVAIVGGDFLRIVGVCYVGAVFEDDFFVDRVDFRLFPGVEVDGIGDCAGAERDDDVDAFEAFGFGGFVALGATGRGFFLFVFNGAFAAGDDFRFFVEEEWDAFGDFLRVDVGVLGLVVLDRAGADDAEVAVLIWFDGAFDRDPGVGFDVGDRDDFKEFGVRALFFARDGGFKCFVSGDVVGVYAIVGRRCVFAVDGTRDFEGLYDRARAAKDEGGCRFEFFAGYSLADVGGARAGARAFLGIFRGFYGLGIGGVDRAAILFGGGFSDSFVLLGFDGVGGVFVARVGALRDLWFFYTWATRGWVVDGFADAVGGYSVACRCLEVFLVDVFFGASDGGDVFVDGLADNGRVAFSGFAVGAVADGVVGEGDECSVGEGFADEDGLFDFVDVDDCFGLAVGLVFFVCVAVVVFVVFGEVGVCVLVIFVFYVFDLYLFKDGALGAIE